VIHTHGSDKRIKLYEEHTEENRKEARYKTDLPGNIESLIYDGKSYPLNTELEVRIIEISKSGMRILAKENTLVMDAIFHIHLKIGENDKLLSGKVVNCKKTPPDSDEYGCRLVGEDGDLD
jgi:hypothetical protein